MPNDHVNYVKNPKFWKPGLPYLDAVNYKIIPDEQSRIAALRGRHDRRRRGLARQCAGDQRHAEPDRAAQPDGGVPRAAVHGQGRREQAVGATSASARRSTIAINRQNLIDKVYAGFGQVLGPRRRGLRPVAALRRTSCKSKYEKYDLPMAKKLMAEAGSKGFDVTMTTFSTPPDYSAMAALIKNDLSQIGINVNIVPQDPVTFGAKNSAGDFDWDLTARGMRGDVDGYVAEFNPVSPTGPTVYQKWFTGWNGAPQSNPKPIWRLVGNGRITLDTNEAAADVPEARTSC